MLHIFRVIPTPISLETPCLYCRKLRAIIKCLHIRWIQYCWEFCVSADITWNSERLLMSPRQAPISSHQMASVSWCFTMLFIVVHDVLLVIHHVLHMFHDVLQVFHEVLLCFTMFSESCNDRHRCLHYLQSLHRRPLSHQSPRGSQ